MRTLGFDKNEQFYKDSIQKYGVTAKGVHWSSKYNQYIRFEVLTQFIQEDLTNASLIDAGCGFGEYYAYLKENNIEFKEYLGLDCEAAMIFRSILRFPKANFTISNILCDKLKTKDYYVASGSLNILKQDEFYTFIDNCYKASKRGFVFNFLTQDSFNKIKKEDVLSYCQQLCPRVHTKEGYLYNDMTIFMEKKSN